MKLYEEMALAGQRLPPPRRAYGVIASPSINVEHLVDCLPQPSSSQYFYLDEDEIIARLPYEPTCCIFPLYDNAHYFSLLCIVILWIIQFLTIIAALISGIFLTVSNNIEIRTKLIGAPSRMISFLTLLSLQLVLWVAAFLFGFLGIRTADNDSTMFSAICQAILFFDAILSAGLLLFPKRFNDHEHQMPAVYIIPIVVNILLAFLTCLELFFLFILSSKFKQFRKLLSDTFTMAQIRYYEAYADVQRAQGQTGDISYEKKTAEDEEKCVEDDEVQVSNLVTE